MQSYSFVFILCLSLIQAIVASPVLKLVDNGIEKASKPTFPNNYAGHVAIPDNDHDSSSTCNYHSALIPCWAKKFTGLLTIHTSHSDPSKEPLHTPYEYSASDQKAQAEQPPTTNATLLPLQNKERFIAPAVILFVMLWMAVLAVGFVEAVSSVWERWVQSEMESLHSRGLEEGVREFWDEITLNVLAETGEESGYCVLEGGEADRKGAL